MITAAAVALVMAFHVNGEINEDSFSRLGDYETKAECDTASVRVKNLFNSNESLIEQAKSFGFTGAYIACIDEDEL
jgi:hypothetical protein